MKELVLKYLAKTLNMKGDAVAELMYKKSEDGKLTEDLKEDALSLLYDADKTRVTGIEEGALKGEAKTNIYNKAFADAKVEVLGKVEKDLAKKHDIAFEGDKPPKLNELVTAIVTKSVDAVKETSKLTDDKVKAHPVYLKLENEKTNELEGLKTAHATEIQKMEDAVSKNALKSTAKGLAGKYFDSLNPVLSSDTTRATNQRSDFLNKFEIYDFTPVEGSDPVPMKDGKRITDGHNNLSLEQLVGQMAGKFFDFAKQGAAGSAGNGNEDDGASGVKLPKSKEDLQQQILNTPAAKDQIALADAWNAANPNDTVD